MALCVSALLHFTAELTEVAHGASEMSLPLLFGMETHWGDAAREFHFHEWMDIISASETADHQRSRLRYKQAKGEAWGLCRGLHGFPHLHSQRRLAYAVSSCFAAELASWDASDDVVRSCSGDENVVVGTESPLPRDMTCSAPGRWGTMTQ